MVNNSGKLKASQDDAKTKTSDNTTAKAPSSPSLATGINTVLSAVILIGLGAIVGYMVFYSIYNHRCSDMMDDAEGRFNQTREDLSHQLLEAVHQPINDDNAAVNNMYNNEGGSESELLELRGHLEEQAVHWMDKHQTLLDKHQSTVEQLNQVQEKQLQTSQLENNYHTSLKQVSELERKLNVASVQKEASDKRLKQANEKVARLQIEAKTGEASPSNDCEQSMSHIQKLHSAICKEKYGEGPYYVQFDMEIDGDEEDKNTLSFVVEIGALLDHEQPNSVFSFLTLASSGIYDGAEFLPTQSSIHLNSDEQKVASLGYATSALSLVEGRAASASAACAPYSVGFVGAHGGLKIVMTNDASRHGSLACFGRIADRRQTVSRIQQAGREGKTVFITSVKTMKMAFKPTVGEGEL